MCYYRCEYADGIDVRLIAAKTKVAPIRSMSIPRLELEAALTSTKLSKVVARCLKVEKQNIVFWSDSMNVLWWITRRSKKLTPFVGNRVARIQEESSVWRHVPTKQNPADLASRGSTVVEL